MKEQESRRERLERAGGLLFLLLCALIAMARLGRSNPVEILLCAAAAWTLYKRSASYALSRRAKLPMGVFALLFSLAVMLGRSVHYAGIRSSMWESYVTLSAGCLLGAAALAALLYPLLLWLLHKTEGLRLAGDGGKSCFFALAWAVIFLGWTPYLLSWYPGGIVGDGALTLELALEGGVPANDHWVVAGIYALRFFLWLGRLSGLGKNFGVFLYAVVQSLLYSGCCAAVCRQLQRLGTPRLFLALSVLLYAGSGFFASYGISLWKDGLFGGGVVLMVLLLWNLPKDEPPGAKTCLAFGLLSLFLCLWKNNGLYMLLPCLAGIALLLRRQGRRLVLSGLAAALLITGFRGPGYKALGIEKDAVNEAFSVPLQQLAAVVSEGAELTPEQREVLFSLMPEEVWRENYAPTLSDDLKNSMDKDWFSAHVGDFLKVWAQLLPEHLGTYVRAYLMLMLGYWQPGVFQGNYWDYWLGVEDILGRGWVQEDLIRAAAGFSLQGTLSRATRFVSSGTMVWLMLLCLSLVLAQGRDVRRRVLVLTPLLASWLVILLASPIAFAYRYIVMLPMALPLLCVLPLTDGTAGGA